MSVLSSSLERAPQAIVIPSGAPYPSYPNESPEFQALRQALEAGGVEVVSFSDLPLPTVLDYHLDMRSGFAGQVSEYAASKRSAIESAGALVVVNKADEEVSDAWGTEVLFTVPNSMGHLACNFMRDALDVYGPGSGRIYVSHFLADTRPLRPAQYAGVRKRNEYVINEVRPIELRGDYGRLVSDMHQRNSSRPAGWEDWT